MTRLPNADDFSLVPTNHFQQRCDSSSSKKKWFAGASMRTALPWRPQNLIFLFFLTPPPSHVRFSCVNVGIPAAVFWTDPPFNGVFQRSRGGHNYPPFHPHPHRPRLWYPLPSPCTRGHFWSRSCFQWHQNNHPVPQGNPIKRKTGQQPPSNPSLTWLLPSCSAAYHRHRRH